VVSTAISAIVICWLRTDCGGDAAGRGDQRHRGINIFVALLLLAAIGVLGWKR
jgi:hypothetical protein